MRKAILMGLGFRTIFGLDVEAAIGTTVLSASLKARKTILIGIILASIAAVLQYILMDINAAIKYALRVYVLSTAFGSALYKTPPDEILSVCSRLHIPWRITLVIFLTLSYLQRNIDRALDAKLVSERKYSSLRDRLHGTLVSMLYSALYDSITLAELIEVYLKSPVRPYKGYLANLLAFITALLLPLATAFSYQLLELYYL